MEFVCVGRAHEAEVRDDHVRHARALVDHLHGDLVFRRAVELDQHVQLERPQARGDHRGELRGLPPGADLGVGRRAAQVQRVRVRSEVPHRHGAQPVEHLRRAEQQRHDLLRVLPQV